MGELQEAERVTIGVTSDQPPLGYVDRKTREPSGLTVDLGRLVADTLGIEAEVVTSPSATLMRRMDEGGIDLAFPILPLTENAVRAHPFSTPYLLSHERLLVPEQSAASSLEDLGGGTVCAAIDPRTQVSPELLEPSLRVIASDPQGCMDEMRAGRVAGVVAGDVWLRWLQAKLRDRAATKIVGDELSTEGYGAVLAEGQGWLPFVNSVLTEAEEDGTWARIYERWVGPAPPPPDLTAEEAAALWPSSSNQ
jgi:polar amino acid transport system substrate-binding protein